MLIGVPAKEQFEEGPIAQADIYQTESYPSLMGPGLSDDTAILCRCSFWLGRYYITRERGIVESCRSRKEAECSSTRRSLWVACTQATNNLVEGGFEAACTSSSSSRWACTVPDGK